ncbi:unnamed protein product [Arabidopsis halleri]
MKKQLVAERNEVAIWLEAFINDLMHMLFFLNFEAVPSSTKECGFGCT